MSRKDEPSAGGGLALALLQGAIGFLAVDVLMPGEPTTATARKIRRTAADAAARFHQHLHAEEDLTTPEEDLHTHLGPA